MNTKDTCANKEQNTVKFEIQNIAQAALDFLQQERPNTAKGIDVLQHFVNLTEYAQLPTLPSEDEPDIMTAMREFQERSAQQLEDAVGRFLQDEKHVELITKLCQILTKPIQNTQKRYTVTIPGEFGECTLTILEWEKVVVVQSLDMLDPEYLHKRIKLPKHKTWFHESNSFGSCNWEILIPNKIGRHMSFKEIIAALKLLRGNKSLSTILSQFLYPN